MTPFEFWSKQVEVSADAWARYWRFVEKSQARMVKSFTGDTTSADMENAYDTAANSPVELFPKVPVHRSKANKAAK